MRLKPIAPGELTTEQHEFYDEMQSGIAVSYKDVQYQDERGALIGPFNPWLHEPDIGRAIWRFNRALNTDASVPARPREVATLVVGAHFRAKYEVESHEFYAPRAGVPESAVEMIVSGVRPGDLTDEEESAYDMAAALCAGGVVPKPIYQRALRLFGSRSLAELVYMCSFYAVACMTMNAFDVAGPE